MKVDYAPTDEEIAATAEGRTVSEQATLAAADEMQFATAPFSEDVVAPLVPPVALGVIAFAVVGLVIWAGQRVTHVAGGMAPGMTHGADREVARDGDPAVRGAASSSGITSYYTARATNNPGSPSYAPSGGAAYAAAAPAPRPAFQRINIKGPFLALEARTQAKSAIQPLHDLMKLVRHYDGGPIWNAPDGSGGGGTTAGSPTNTLPAMPNGTGGGSGVAPVILPPPPGSSAAAATRGATFVNTGQPERVASAEQVRLQIESLSTQVTLSTHPELYPDPLRPAVREMSKEIHLYLKDAEAATTPGATTDAGRIHSQASRRLARADSLLRFMDNVASGAADLNEMP